MKITKATRWRVFAGVWIQSLFTSATAFFSLFCLPFCNQFGWSNSDFSMAYTIYMFIYCAVGFLGGILAEKLQPRVAIYIGLVLFAGGWILTGFASSISFLYIAYGVIAGAGAGTIYPACLPTALKWFPDKSGSISGLVQAGAACGPFIMSPIAQMLIDNFGAPMACKILGVVFLIGVGAVAWMIVPCPDGWTPEGWVPSAQQSKELHTKDYNIPQMVKTIFGSKYYNRNYGLIFIGYGIGAFVGPKISASFFDATGSYVMGFIGSAILAAVAVLLVVVAKKLANKMLNA